MKTASFKLTAQVRVLHFWCWKFYNCLWKCSDLKGNPASNEVRTQIENKLFEIKKLVDDHYAPKIGRAVISEIK